MKTFINLTPHPIVVDRNGSTIVYQPSGKVARIQDSLSDFNEDGIATISYGAPIDLPDEKTDTYLIVSAMVKNALPNRSDLVSPATSLANRDENGHIISVPGFVH